MPGVSRSVGRLGLDKMAGVMAGQKRSITNEFAYDAVLLDIEGTTTPISFVKVRN